MKKFLLLATLVSSMFLTGCSATVGTAEQQALSGLIGVGGTYAMNKIAQENANLSAENRALRGEAIVEVVQQPVVTQRVITQPVVTQRVLTQPVITQRYLARSVCPPEPVRYMEPPRRALYSSPPVPIPIEK